MSLAIGLMSGTSMDGIDAVLINTKRQALIHGITVPYPDELQHHIRQLDAQQPMMLKNILKLNQHIGQAFAYAAQKLLDATQYKVHDIVVVGSHGQTILHEPEAPHPVTLQLGCAHTICQALGIPVVADFRTRDLILGGQGAPLAPYYHDILFAQHQKPLAIVNIGGVSNITMLSKDKPPLGFDTGPGNALLDAWIWAHRKIPYDQDGQWAQSGQLLPELLEALCCDPYFTKPSPKSLDKHYFSINQYQSLCQDKRPEDVQNTLTHFTAKTIAQAMPSTITQVMVCGGGAHNQYLLDCMKQYLPKHHIQSTQASNISPDYIEAMMFGWLAYQTINGQSIDLSLITGSSRSAILGAIYR